MLCYISTYTDVLDRILDCNTFDWLNALARKKPQGTHSSSLKQSALRCKMMYWCNQLILDQSPTKTKYFNMYFAYDIKNIGTEYVLRLWLEKI